MSEEIKELKNLTKEELIKRIHNLEVDIRHLERNKKVIEDENIKLNTKLYDGKKDLHQKLDRILEILGGKE